MEICARKEDIGESLSVSPIIRCCIKRVSIEMNVNHPSARV